jgi:hypothetical protein
MVAFAGSSDMLDPARNMVLLLLLLISLVPAVYVPVIQMSAACSWMARSN